MFNADAEMVDSWRRKADLPEAVLVVADPEASLYRELGTERQDPVSLVLKSIKGGIRSAGQGLLPRATRTDMLRLGADVAVDANGDITLLHRATGADDRLPVERLVEAVAA